MSISINKRLVYNLSYHPNPPYWYYMSSYNIIGVAFKEKEYLMCIYYEQHINK